MDTHVLRLGAFNIAFGVLSLIASLIVFAVYGAPTTIYRSSDDTVLGLLIAGSALFHFVLAIPCVVGGIYLRFFADWSRGMMTVTSALNVLNPPFGSVLGFYGLWVLLTDETDPLFNDPQWQARNGRPARPAKPSSSRVKPRSPKQKAATGAVVPSPRS